MRLAGSDVATASAQASIKALHSNSGLLLATRHCYILEDPPDNKKDSTESKRFRNYTIIFLNILCFCSAFNLLRYWLLFLKSETSKTFAVRMQREMMIMPIKMSNQKKKARKQKRSP